MKVGAYMDFLLFLGPIIGVSVSIIAVIVIVTIIGGAVAGSEEDFDD